MPKPLILALFAALCALALTCKKEPLVKPEVPERVKLTLIDVAVKEAYFHIAVTSPASNETLALQRNGTTVMTFPAVADTNIADTALAQTTTYQYTARLTTNSETTGTSNTIAAQTLAPTSHNFTWQTFLLGDGNGSALYDVAIINDTLAYAVGEIYLSGDPLPYNLAKWNGQQWELKRVTVMYRGSPITPPLNAIFAFSATDIWLSSGVPIHGDGQNWTQYHLFDMGILTQNDGSINKIWGSSSELWFVGNRGTIVHQSPTGTWRRVESGTTTQINDAWGVVNPVSGQVDVYCVASAFFAPEAEKKILRIQNVTDVDSIPWGVGRNMFGIWSAKGFPLFTAGSGVFENSRGRWREAPLIPIYTNAVRGNATNDVVVVGDLGYAAHFNGSGWFIFPDLYNASYYAVSMKGNKIAMVGEQNARGVISIGRR